MATVAASAAAQRQFEESAKRGFPVSSDSTLATAVGDVDGDGDLDLVLGVGGQSVLYLNLLRQLDAPYVFHVGRNYQLDV